MAGSQEWLGGGAVSTHIEAGQTPRETAVTLDDATQAMKALFEGQDSGLDRTLKLDFGGDGVVFIDARGTPNTVSNDDGDADTTMIISLADFARLRSGELQGQQAFMTGALQVEGDLMGAMAFGSYTASRQ